MVRNAMTSVLLLSLLAGCTTRYQVRGTEKGLEPIPLDELIGEERGDKEREDKALQISMEHQSVERYEDFSLGIIEISDEGFVNPGQKSQVIDMVAEETKDGGLLIVFVHGWHHGARVCDRDLCCYREVLSQLKKARLTQKGKVVGVYIGWRGESFPYKGWNIATLWSRKRVAEHIGRTTGKEILLELNDIWEQNEDLTMVTAGHSLGGAFLFSAVKGKLTGNVSDIEMGKVRSYRVVRAEADRKEALRREVKALRAGFGDLVVLVNPAIEASEYKMFDNDLIDKNAPTQIKDLIDEKLPYDKHHRYDRRQLPVLMTVASTADTAVGRFFPPARVLGDLVTLQWRQFLDPAQRSGMGRYAPHVTHRLDYTEHVARDRGVVAEDCGCTKLAEGEVDFGTEALDLESREPEKKYGKMTFGPTQKRLDDRDWDPNSPYLVVQTGANVIDEHSDIFNPIFVGFLRKFIEAYVTKQEKYDIADDIAGIRAVDTQFHGNIAERTMDEDGLPPVGARGYPVRLTTSHDSYVEAWQSLYGYRPVRGEVVTDHVREEIKLRAIGAKKAGYPAWILDRVGVEYALVDEPQLGQDLVRPRFRWIPSADALLTPFDPDQAKLLLEPLGLSRLPESLGEYFGQVVGPTLGRWEDAGAVAVKLVLSYEPPARVLPQAEADQIYRALSQGHQVSDPTRIGLADFLLRELARSAGEAGLVVRVQAVAPADPRPLAAVFDDPSLSDTRFVLVQGGFPNELETCDLLKKPNLYAELSSRTLGRLVREKGTIVRHWLEEHPDKILFASDASAHSEIPLGGWEENEWLLVRAGREALVSTLGILLEEERIDKARAVDLARMVLRDNAIRLYDLDGASSQRASAALQE